MKLKIRGFLVEGNFGDDIMVYSNDIWC